MIALATALLLNSAGTAVTGPVEHAPPEPAAAAPAEPPFRFGGRVALRERVALIRAPGATTDPTGEIEVSTARIDAEYRQGDVRAVLEADLVEGDPLKDAFLEIEPSNAFEMRAGQFKAPLSAIESESSWTLPTIRRGFLHEVLVDGLMLAGRRPGAQLRWKGDGALEPRLLAGVWQGGPPGSPRAGEDADWFGHNAAARGSIEPRKGLQLGAGAEWRTAEPAPGVRPRRFHAAAVDVVFERKRGLRLWGEALGGSSWHDADPADGRDALFAGSRWIAGWRFDVGQRGMWLEPFALAGMLDPNLAVRRDALVETAAGLNVGRGSTWKVQVQLEAADAERNAPAGLAGTTAPVAMRAAMAQVGMRF